MKNSKYLPYVAVGIIEDFAKKKSFLLDLCAKHIHYSVICILKIINVLKI